MGSVLFNEELGFQGQIYGFPEHRPLPPEVEMPDADAPVPRVVLLDECLAALLVLFPDIDPAYIARLYEEHVWDEGVSLVELVVDLVLETNGNYPKAQKGDKSSKRKRERSPSEMTAAELDTKYNHAERPPPRPSYTSLSRKLLRNAFPYVPATVIDAELGKKYFLFPAFKALAQTEANYDKAEVKPYKKLGRMRKNLSEDALAREGENLSQQENESLRSEFRAAVRLYEAMTIQGRIRAGASEVASPDTAQDEALFECGCCFGEVPFLELTQCSDGHLFCFDCGRRNAETEVGQQKYKLLCMDASGCRKEFPPNEIKRFCDEKTVEILERLEQRDVLRLAEIDDLSECPFCDFAAILPPVEFDREFRCHNPECMKVSCRMCDKETHIPLTCEEKAKEENSNLRRDVEEAMTEALLRKCGKCGLPYVKESGCNKITCSRCSAINCYLCSKVIKDYKHFNDSSRGGRAGNCLLFDNTDERHHNEVQAAEQAAINRVRAENPGISEEAMRVKLSRVVLDEERQRIEDGNRRLGINNPPAIAAVAARQAAPPPPMVQAPPVLQPQPLIRRLPAGPPQVNLPAPPANFLQALQGIPPGAGPQAPAGPVIYNPVPIPFQPVLAQQLPHNPVPIVPHAQVIGFQDLPPMIQQVLRNPLIQAPQLPMLGNPVPFLGEHANIYQVAPAAAAAQVEPPQPANIFQRVAGFAGLLPVARPAARGHAALEAMPPALPQPVPLNVFFNQNMPAAHGHPLPNVNPPAPIPAVDGAGFMQRNFNMGGNRLVGRGRQVARPQPNFNNPRPGSFVDNGLLGRAVVPPPAPAANDKPMPMSQPRNHRPAKIAKRASRY